MFSWFSILIDVALAAALGFFIYRAVTGYQAATGTVWQRLWAAVEGSASILWGYFVVAVGTVLDWTVQVATYAGQPDVSNYIQTNISAATASKVVAAIGLITVLARLRTLYRERESGPAGGENG
jgi:hypothetical protein